MFLGKQYFLRLSSKKKKCFEVKAEASFLSLLIIKESQPSARTAVMLSFCFKH